MRLFFRLIQNLSMFIYKKSPRVIIFYFPAISFNTPPPTAFFKALIILKPPKLQRTLLSNIFSKFFKFTNS